MMICSIHLNELYAVVTNECLSNVSFQMYSCQKPATNIIITLILCVYIF